MNSSLLSLVLSALFCLPNIALAQRRPPQDDTRRIDRLERAVDSLSERVTYLEDLLNANPLPPPRENLNVCMLVDAGYSKTFLGSGKTKLDAEFNAQQNCAKAVSPSFCVGGASQLKCDDSLSSNAIGFVCVVVDAGYKKTFRGEGRTAFEAEANAKIACQSSVSPSYCGKVTARCEEVF
jgi:hypothetical protein